MPHLVIPAPAGLSLFAGHPDLRRCPGCGCADNMAAVTPRLAVAPYKSPDLSETSDGALLASPAFRRRYAAEGWSGLRFIEVGRGYALVRAARRVRLLRADSYHYDCPQIVPGLEAALPRDHLAVRHSGSCGCCGRYRESFGGGGRVIARGELAPRHGEFVVGDAAMGEGDGKCVDLIAAGDIAAAHLRQRLRGVSILTQVELQAWGQTAGTPAGTAAEVIALRR